MGYGLEFSSGVADGGVAHILDSDNAFTSGTLLSIRNNSSQKFSVDFEGSVVAHDVAVGGALTVAETTVITGALSGANAAGPTVVNEAATGTNPTLIPNKADVDTGLGWQAADALAIIAGGVQGIRVTESAGSIVIAMTDDVTVTGSLKGTNAAGPGVLNEAAASTNPTLVPSKADLDTGIGRQTADSLALIAGGVEGVRIVEDTTITTHLIGRTLHPTITTLADDATPSVSAGNLFKTGGTTSITDFDDGVIGQTITILAAHSVTITNGSPIILAGGANFSMVASDTLTLTMIDDQVWQEVSRSVN